MSVAVPGPGTVLGGRYRIVSPLGRGGMGSVWRADHLTLGTPVAVKVMDPAIATDEARRAEHYGVHGSVAR